MIEDETDPRRAARIAYAQSLTEYEDQMAWYSRKASPLRRKAQFIDLLIIMLGALIAAFPALKALHEPAWIDLAVSILGGAIVLSQGLQRIYRFGDLWTEYRRASERMKSEKRMFINAVPPYNAEAEERSRILYVEALEKAIAEERKLFFEGAKPSQSED